MGGGRARQELTLQHLHLHHLPPATSCVLMELTQLFPPDAADAAGEKGAAGGGEEGAAAGRGHGSEAARRGGSGASGPVEVSRSVQVCVAAAVCGWHEQLLLLSHLAEDEEDEAKLAPLRIHAADLTAQLEVTRLLWVSLFARTRARSCV